MKFKEFKNAKGKKLIPGKISSIFISGSATANNKLYFNKLALLFPRKIKNYVKFTTNKKLLSVFQRGEAVEMTFSIGDSGIPTNAKALEYAITDYFNENVKSGKIELSTASKYKLKFDPLKSGYYDVKAYWVDKNNKNFQSTHALKLKALWNRGAELLR